MKNLLLAKLITLAVSVFVLGMLVPGNAYCWSAATHAYIEEHLFKKQGQVDEEVMFNRIYGANVMDIFNDNFSPAYQEYSAILHDITKDNFLEVWEMAYYQDEKAFAYGFVGHNNIWGMDSTAHISGITFGRGEGYVIAKAKILAEILKPFLDGLTTDYDVKVNICHYLVESAVDLMVRDLDPSIGSKLMLSASNSSNTVSALLAAAYSDNIEELDVVEAEGFFKGCIWYYGWCLSQDNAFDYIASGLASMGLSYLNLPSVYYEPLLAFAQSGLTTAMSLCAPDFEAELKATTGWVNGKLSSHKISW